MTCIVALKHKNKIYMGGDSMGSNPVTMQKTIRLDEKVFKKNDMIFGFAGSFRMGQILRYAFDIPIRHEDLEDMEYLVGFFIPALIKCFDEQGFLKKPEESEVEGGTFLLGYRSNIYDVSEDFQVGRPSLNYEALGSGDDTAKGSLYSTEKCDKKMAPDKKLSPAERVILALEAAAEHSAGVSPPFIVECL